MLKSRKIIKLIGIFMILFALFANPFILKQYSPDKELILLTSIIIISFEFLFLILGVYLFTKPKNYKNILMFFIIIILLWFPLDFTLTKIDQHKQDVVYRQKHPIYQHSLVPNSEGLESFPSGEAVYFFKTNSHGLRNPEIPAKNDRIRILVLGDSFTEGAGVNYTESVSKKLNDYLGENFEVINAGVSSYSPTLEYLYLINDGIKLEPDMVILNYDNSDILSDMKHSLSSKFENGKLVAVKQRKLEQFHFTDRLFQILHIWGINYGILEYSKIITFQGNKAHHTFYDTCEEFKDDWNYSYKYIKEIKNYLDKKNTPFYIVIYPWGHQVATNQWTKGRLLMSFKKDVVYPFSIADCFENYTDVDLTVFNLLLDFKEASKNKKLYWDINGHFNEEGYDLLAKGTYERLLLDENFKKIKNEDLINAQ